MTPKICNRAKRGIDLRTPLRAGASKAEPMSMIASGLNVWRLTFRFSGRAFAISRQYEFAPS